MKTQMKGSLRKNSKMGKTVFLGEIPVAKYMKVNHEADLRPCSYFSVYSYIKDKYVFDSDNEDDCFDVLNTEFNEFVGKICTIVKEEKYPTIRELGERWLPQT
jgi:hypothetical protein